jgi:glycerol-3-phosphate acyltransferase PlsY
VLASYLLGSIPTGFLVARARGLDIRTVGSGNIGATNVFRYLGKPAGIFVLLMDALKGWLAVAVLSKLLQSWPEPGASTLETEWISLCAGLGAVLGHNFTFWLHFKGGKGIATSAGVLTALVPGPLLIIFAVFVVVFALTRYVSLGSICASAALPPACLITGQSLLIVIVCSVMSVLAIYKHRSNIKRLLAGTESRIGSPKTPVPHNPPGR